MNKVLKIDRTISEKGGVKLETNKVYLGDCIEGMKNMKNNSVDFTLTDIPYGEVNRSSGGLRNLDKETADVTTFDLNEFLEEVWRVTKGTIIIFCGRGQLSTISQFFDEKQEQKKGTPRVLVWKKTNPSPMNGQYVYLSGVELAMWFRKRGGTFNAHCKNTVFAHPLGRGKLHPTEKNHKLLEELILDNSNEGDIVFDPCAGSGAHLLVAKNLKRKYLGFELNEEFYNIIQGRLNE